MRLPRLSLAMFALGFVAIGVFDSHAAAQERAIPSQRLSSADKILLYESQKKSEIGAFLIEGAIPFVGHAYAGDVHKGVVPAGCRVGGFVLMIAGMASATENAYGGDSSSGLGVMTVGLLAYTGCSVWDVVAAYQNAAGFNRNLRQQLGVTPTFSVAPSRLNGKPELQLGVSIPLVNW